MLNKLCGVAALAVVLLCLPFTLVGQVTTGTILGTIHDASGAAVTGAKVTITDNSKGTTSAYQTDDSGTYNAPFLIPGTYSVSVEKEGFKRAISQNVVLDVDQKARVDIALEIGQVSQTLEVTAVAPLVRSESAELGEVVAQRQVQDLPLNGRNFAQLVDLVPGVSAGQPGENLSGSSSFNPRAASNFNALGSQANTNGWLVDGIDDNEWTFNTVMVQPSVESIAEFKVLTGTFSAEFGRGAGVVSVSTRSGSNDFHGEAFNYLRNSFMDARNYFNPSSQVQPEYRRNQFGGALGGRILKDKLFFFGDYYGQRSLKGIVNLNSVPTAAERVGDFSNYLNTKGQLIPIYNPLTTNVVGAQTTRSVYAGNIIPASQLNSVGLAVASIYPLPQAAGSFNNYTSAANQVINDNGGNGRLDYRLSDKDSMFFRYSFEDFIQNAPNPLVGGSGQCCLPTPAFASSKYDLGPYIAGIQNTNLAAQGAAFNETHLFGPTLLNEFRMGYSRTNPFTFQSDYGHNSSTSLGIQGLNVSQYATGLPNIQIGSSCGAEFTCIQGGQAFLPANPRQTNIQFEDTLSYTVNKHQLKFGFRYIRELASPFTNTTTRGQFTFNDNFTDNPAVPTGTGSGLAALLIGYPNSGSRNYLQTPYYVSNGEWAGFFEDDWKVSSRLTLNLGLRYDVFTPDTEARNRLANFSFKNLAYVYPYDANNTTATVGIQTRYGNLGPRVGFAYDVTGKSTTVIRGGFGIVYFPDPFSASNELGQQPPFTVSQTFSDQTNPLGSAYATPCTAANLASSCLPVINNPFPQGVTPISPGVMGNTAQLNAAAPAVIGHEMKNLTPYMETWNFDIERQITPSSLFEIAYAGSRGIHLTYCYNPDEVEPGTPGVSSAGSTQSRRLIQPLNNISTWVQCDERNMSNYHSLQAKFTRRYSKGLTSLLSYTFSRSLDYGGSAASGGGAVGNPQTVTNLKAGYGPSGFDQMHRFVGSVTYELPFGQGRQWLQSGVVSKVAGGWELDGIVTFASGLPFTVNLNSGVNFGAPSWPNRIASGTLSNPDPAMWFNTSAFVAPAFNTFGNSARGVLYGPSTANWDISAQRQFKLIERVSLKLRLDAFNAFNTPNFNEPNANIGSPTAGVITSTLIDNRDLQASATIVF